MKFVDRLQHAWNAFVNNRDPTYSYNSRGATSYSYRPDRVRFSNGNEKTLVTSIYNKIALDVAALDIRHVRLDADDRFIGYIHSGLDNCLTVEANLDQTGRSFIQDVVMSMFDEGVVAIVPVDTTLNPKVTGSFDINSMRTGKITEWRPKEVKVRVYNDRTGEKEDVILPKSMVAIIENPLFAVINEPNSTMRRLIRKLAILDAIDEQSGAGKLDLIIQLPYTIKSPARRQQAEERRADIEKQLSGSKYGIAYTDGTERVTQLNRPIENNLMKQIEFLTNTLYGQLGLHQSILDGTADEQTQINYRNRTIKPIASAIVDEMRRKFLTKTARTQGQSIRFFSNPFELIPILSLSNIADSFTRNEIMSSNEFRQVMGYVPSDDPRADQLVNSNLYQQGQNMMEEPAAEGEMDPAYNEQGGNQNGETQM